jgi:hypothetical protein
VERLAHRGQELHIELAEIEADTLIAADLTEEPQTGDDRKPKNGHKSMLIDTAGKYTTRNGKTADIFRVDRTTAVGRVPDIGEALVWDVSTGDAIGHDLGNSVISKYRNLPAIALAIQQMLSDLSSDAQRLQVLSIVKQQICDNCGAIIEPGRTCRCMSPVVQRGTKGKKKVH